MERLKQPCLICLVIFLGVVGLVELHILVKESLYTDDVCDDHPGIAWARDINNCSLYYLCIEGHALPMPACATDQVWSTKALRCVQVESELNDCPFSRPKLVKRRREKVREHKKVKNVEAAQGWTHKQSVRDLDTEGLVEIGHNGKAEKKNVKVISVPANRDNTKLTDGQNDKLSENFGNLPGNERRQIHSLDQEKILREGNERVEEERLKQWYLTPGFVKRRSSDEHPPLQTTPFAPDIILQKPRVDVGFIGEIFPGHPCSFITTETVLPHPRACHRYYNCSLSPWDPQWGPVEPMTAECPYPELFSVASRRCLPFGQVSCGDRPEFKEPCDYRENTICNHKDCRPCKSRKASCVGYTNGVYPFPTLEWSPWYIVCKDERTLKQASCSNETPVFSPVTSTCVSSREVPKELGGSLPSCRGRVDGYHLDETGDCHKFFHCAHGNVMSSAACEDGSMFDPVSLTCSLSATIPPCGFISPTDPPVKYCVGRSDGFHGDLHGRCPLYFECKNQELRAYLKCPFGSFNPRTKECDTSMDVPAPCGLQANPCLGKADGRYADIDEKCLNVISCFNGYVSTIEACPEGLVFDETAQKCQPLENTSPPCGIAPSCKNLSDGKHPAVFKGCQHYFTCQRDKFQEYGQCGLDQGGFFFNPVTRTCDFPQNICPPCGSRKDCP